MRHLGKTPPFRGPHGEAVSGSVAEIAYRRLGGLDQWVMGADRPAIRVAAAVAEEEKRERGSWS